MVKKGRARAEKENKMHEAAQLKKQDRAAKKEVHFHCSFTVDMLLCFLK
jgi:hypothetical protein